MRLLKRNPDGTVSLTKELYGTDIPQYAILSHTWGADEDEVTFRDLSNDDLHGHAMVSQKPGFNKIDFCAEQAASDGLTYFWIDTCCIDKSNNVELTEALNSMFRWYRRAARCYVFLTDVPNAESVITQLEQSKWFTRGWTLQESIAPEPDRMHFFARDRSNIGSKTSLEISIATITGIPLEALRGGPLFIYAVEERLKWQEHRQTKREEDKAYSLLGIFDVVMPLIYGEGEEHAFERLYTEVEKRHGENMIPRMRTATGETEKVALASLAYVDQSQFVADVIQRSWPSCPWIFQCDEFISWRDGQSGYNFVILANAGCGKTTLAAHILQALRSNLDNLVLSFFFQDGNMEAAQTSTDVLTALTYQLVSQVPALSPMLSEKHTIYAAGGYLDWSWRQIAPLLNSLLHAFRGREQIYIVLDALDECDYSTRRMLISWLNNINTFMVNSSVKILLTSRPDDGMLDALADCWTLPVTPSNTAEDISNLIERRVLNLAHRRSLDFETSTHIEQFLRLNAKGMFIWVTLVLDELEARGQRLTEDSVNLKLENIPSDLIGLYNTLLSSTLSGLFETVQSSPAASRSVDMWRMLRWIVHASRDMHVKELEAILCFETATTRWYDFEGDVRSLCGSFIRIEGERIKIAHHTAKTYLETVALNALRPYEDHSAAVDELATICIQYMLQHDMLQRVDRIVRRSDNYRTGTTFCRKLLKDFRFLNYAIIFWANHARQVDSTSSTFFELLREFLDPQPRGDGTMRLLWMVKGRDPEDAPVNATALHIAAYFNLSVMVKAYVKEDPNSVHNTAGADDTPLIWASEMGSCECVQILLDAGANTNAYELDGWSALHWAARNGHDEVVQLLCRHGADIDHCDQQGFTALDWAMDKKMDDVVKTLKLWSEASGRPSPKSRRTSGMHLTR